MTAGRWAAGPSGVLIAVAIGCGVPAAPASAHAVLAATVPAPASVVASVPGFVELTFDGPATPVPGRTRVVAPDGKRINDGDPVRAGGGLRIALRAPDRPRGTYLVSYRVISADSHPVSGTFTFSVGAASAAAPRSRTAGVDPAVDAAVPVARYLGYLGLILVAGPVLLLVVLWPGRPSRRAPLRLARTGLGLLAVGGLATLWLQAPYASGAAPFDVSPGELRQVVGSRFGAAVLARLCLVAAVAALLGPALAGGAHPGGSPPDPGGGARPRRRAAARAALLVSGLAGLVTWPLAGHPAASPQPVVTTAADTLHLAAMAVWLGGLLALVGFVLRRDGPGGLRPVLAVWSRLATVAVGWLVLGGAALALVENGRPGNLVSSAYGRLLLVKIALLGAVLAVAACSRRIVHGHAVTAAPGGPGRLRGTVAAELAIAALVLAASAVLTRTVPGRVAGVEAAAAARARGFATTLTSDLYTVQFEIFPLQRGEYNTVHAVLTTPDGRPLRAAEWRLTAALPDRGVEPLENPIVAYQDNQGMGTVDFPLPGRWQLRITIRISDTDQATVTTTVTVP